MKPPFGDTGEQKTLSPLSVCFVFSSQTVPAFYVSADSPGKTLRLQHAAQLLHLLSLQGQPCFSLMFPDGLKKDKFKRQTSYWHFIIPIAHPAPPSQFVKSESNSEKESSLGNELPFRESEHGLRPSLTSLGFAKILTRCWRTKQEQVCEQEGCNLAAEGMIYRVIRSLLRKICTQIKGSWRSGVLWSTRSSPHKRQGQMLWCHPGDFDGFSWTLLLCVQASERFFTLVPLVGSWWGGYFGIHFINKT